MLEFIGAFLAIFGALGVLLMPSALNGAITMVVAFIGVGALLANMGAHFLAISEIAVYAGAILVLIVFVLMLLNLKEEKMKVSFAGAVSFVSLAALIYGIYKFFGFSSKSTQYFYVGPKEIGDLLLGKYLVQFELLSILILVGVVSVMHVIREIKRQ